MNATFLFQLVTPIEAGGYLLGEARWPAPVLIRRVRVTCGRATAGGVVVLEMERGGVPSGKTITINVTGSSFSGVFSLEERLEANTFLRWRCVSAPEAVESVSEIGLTLEGDVLVPPPAEEMIVRWVNGSERFDLFQFVRADHSFARLSDLVVGRAAIESDPDLTVRIQGRVALAARVQSGIPVLMANQFVAIGGCGTSESPRLEFHAGSRRLATLTKAGVLRVANVTEIPSFNQGGLDRFEFYAGGILSAILGTSTQLAGQRFVEPIDG